MRITEKQMLNVTVRDVCRQRTQVYDLQQKAVSGRRIRDIIEDPTAASRYRLISEAQNATRHYERNSSSSRTRLEASDSALGQASNLMIRAKEIGLAMGNGTASQEARALASTEVRSLFEAMLGLANTSVAGEFIFAGFSTDQRPFQPDGSFAGDDGIKEVEVGQGARVTVNVSGEAAFTAAGGGVDVFAELESLRAALAANDQAAVTSSLERLDQANDQLNLARADAGLKINQLDVADSLRARLEDSLLAEGSGLVDIDTIQVFLSLNAATNSLQQAITVSQQILDTSSIG